MRPRAQRRALRPRRVAALAGLLTLATLGTACDPVPPPVILRTTSLLAEHDVAPGDGVCEMTAGAGDCSLQAAIDEGNALSTGSPETVVVIEVDPHPQVPHVLYLEETVEVTGNLRIVALEPFFTTIGVTTIHVAAGARLEVQADLVTHRGCDPGLCPPRAETKIDVDGTFIARHTRIHEGGYHILRVNPGGAAYLGQSRLTGQLFWDENGDDGSQAILNAGTLILDHSTVSVAGVRGAVTTVGAGRTVLAGSTITSPARQFLTSEWPAWPEGAGDACGGTPPQSLGGNTAFDETCQLTGAGDVNG